MNAYGALGRHAGFDPPAKESDLLLGPLPVARHRPACEAPKDGLRMRADILEAPEVEGPTHGYSVGRTKQRLDVSCKTGGALLSGHDCAPFPIV
ncbi:MAG: hypothetical protein ACJ8CB_06685 [Ktedonobacteraceae bacterium]